MFTENSKTSKTLFLQYFFDGRKFSLRKKLWGKDIQHINVNAVIITAGIFRIYRILKEMNPDIIHIIAFERFAVAALLYAKVNRVRVIYNVHGVIVHENSKFKTVSLFYRLKDRYCEKMFLKTANKLVFPSESALDVAEDYFRIDESGAVILPSGIDPQFGTVKRNSEKREVLRAVFIYKNEFSRSGLELLSAALFKLRSELELYIICSEKMELKLGSNIKLNWVQFMPAAELAEFYSDKDVFLSLNSYDTFSVSTAEAMGSGLIPLITKQTGIERYIENGINGYIINSVNPGTVSEVIDNLSNMTIENRLSISSNARMLFDSVSWDKVHQMYAELYKEVLL
jgi:glycosyltransferase involved in cell wall biosynthesis